MAVGAFALVVAIAGPTMPLLGTLSCLAAGPLFTIARLRLERTGGRRA